MKTFKKVLLILFCLALSLGLCRGIFAGEIAIYGDSQHNPDLQAKLVEKIASFNPEIVLRVGDLVDDGNDPSQWKAFRQIHKGLLEKTEYFPALGNHEHGSPLYFENFPLLNNQKWYALERLGINFIILDSNSDLSLGSAQYKWLRAQLSRANRMSRFIIVLFHHPLFDVSRVHNSDERAIKPVLLPLFKYYRVSAVFSGHSHDYQRFEYKGIYFIVTGGGGSNLYPQARISPYLRKFNLAYHFCLLTVEDNFLKVKVIDTDSQVIDEFQIPARITADIPSAVL